MNNKKLWGDMHSNIHHGQMQDIEAWYEHAKSVLDFWPIAYYPFYMRPTEFGIGVEDIYDEKIYNADWEKVRELTNKANAEGFPMFMGFEWQGSGHDGDHNVFFLDNNQSQNHPMRYADLVEAYKGIQAIGVPHHIAYQLSSRGKNWATHNEEFSPVAEIYSSHGCSETEEISIPMGRHVHMGPRTGKTDYVTGLNSGYKVGVIASGDNHNTPAISENGSVCVLAKDASKAEIFAALKARHTYGVSKSRIKVDFSIDDAIMGDEIIISDKAVLKFSVEGTNSVDRIEILKDNILDEMVVHSGKYENNELTGVVRFKFKLELGWGPDTRVYKDITSKKWIGSISTSGKVLDVEKCFNNYGQKITSIEDQKVDFEIISYKSTGSGKWMGAENILNESMIFDIQADKASDIILNIDGVEYKIPVVDILQDSKLIPLMQEARELMKTTWGDLTHYRDDPWWHNAYKIKIHKGSTDNGFTVDFQKEINIQKDCN